MRIIVDANIIFSAILNTDGKVGDVLLNSHNVFEFIAPRFLKDEIRKYRR
jgi:predicted nucleic acid-binding protein